jgi:deoxyribonuclease IV
VRPRRSAAGEAAPPTTPPPAPGLRLGAHVSVAGGLPLAFGRARELGCGALQIFVKSASRWVGRALEEDEVAAFRAAWEGAPGSPVLAHAAYLINLAAAPGEVLERSRQGLADELERSRRLGLAGLVVHPGCHGEAGEEEGLRRVAESLDLVLGEQPADTPRVLLETTAGQGTALGWRLEQLERILELARCRERLAVCLDSCHLHAAGYPVDEEEGVERVLAEAVGRFGRARLAAVHLNDSRYPRGARRDRHANIGEGSIGRAAFARWLTTPTLAGVPMILETPGGDDEQGHRRDLATLRALLAV